ncbi:adhesive domain-containing protein [Enterococcus gallinarum]|uniref:adhesive domain-containing protein n=1 Tax=Enterococcus gallinarum TaxID=1353 RepID=UPI001898EBE2|nr:adhesive domain-containing protein [Enterococcus gallinarum]
MKGNDYKKIMNSRRKRRAINKKSLLANLTVSGMLLTSSVVVPTTLLWEPKIAEASLVSAEIFSNVQASNDSATSAAAPYSNPGDTNPVNFTISGSNAVTLDVLNGDKVAIVGVPKGLTGFVQPNGNARVSTNITLQLENIAAIQTLIGTLTPAVDTLVGTVDALVNQNLADALGIPETINGFPNLLYQAASIVDISQVVSVNLDDIYEQLDLLNQLGQFGQADFEVPAGLTDNERALIANVNDGLFIVVNQRIQSILENLKQAQIQVSILGGASNIPGIGSLIDGVNTLVQETVNTAKATLNVTVDAAQAVLNGTTDLADQIASASVLGQTTVVMPTTVTTPTTSELIANGVTNPSNPYEARFAGTFSQSNLLTLDLFTDEDGNNSIWLAAEPAAEQTETPTIDPVAAGDTTISGTAEPDSTVTVTIGNEQPVTAVADAQGNWTAEVPEVSQGETVTVVAEADGKDPSEPVTVSVAGLTVAAPTASISGNETDGYPVIGKATPHAAIEITNAQGDVVGSGTTDSDGNYRIVIAPDRVAPEENLNVTAIVTAGGQDYRSGATPVVVPADTQENQTETPSIDPVNAGDQTISGTAEPNANVVVTVSGEEPVTVVANDQGDWTANVPEVSEGETVTVVATVGDKEPSTPVSVIVSGISVSAPTASITGNQRDGYPVAGRTTANADIEITNAQGEVVGSGTTDGDGNYRIVIAPDQVDPEENLNVAAIVTAGGKDYRSGNTPITVPMEKTATPLIDPAIAGDETVSGTAEPGSSVILIINEAAPVMARILGGLNTTRAFAAPLELRADEAGNWRINVAELSEGDVLTATAQTDGKYVSDPMSIVVSPVTVAAPTATISGNESSGYPVTGKADPNVTIEISNAQGEVVGTGTTDSEGNYRIVVAANRVEPKDNLYVVASVVAGGKEYRSAAATVTVPVAGVDDGNTGGGNTGGGNTGGGNTGGNNIGNGNNGGINIIGNGNISGGNNINSNNSGGKYLPKLAVKVLGLHQ